MKNNNFFKASDEALVWLGSELVVGGCLLFDILRGLSLIMIVIGFILVFILIVKHLG